MSTYNLYGNEKILANTENFQIFAQTLTLNGKPIPTGAAAVNSTIGPAATDRLLWFNASGTPYLITPDALFTRYSVTHVNPS